MSGSQLSVGADDWEAVASNIMYFEPKIDTNPGTYAGLGINNVV